MARKKTPPANEPPQTINFDAANRGGDGKVCTVEMK